MHAPLRLSLLAALLLASCSEKPNETSAVPPGVRAPSDSVRAIQPVGLLVRPALDLIVDQEVSGESAYTRLYARPTDGGGGDSGVTTGIGYDYSAVSQSRALSDWQPLGASWDARLADTAGLSGSAARSRLPGLQDISVAWAIAINEFQVVDVPRYWAECQQAFPGFDDLRPNAQGAVLSVVYNRGTSTVGPSRVDFVALRTSISTQDYAGMAAAIRHMLVTMRVAWQRAGIYADMEDRRNAEADLILQP
jgi:hypothetical protein